MGIPMLMLLFACAAAGATGAETAIPAATNEPRIKRMLTFFLSGLNRKNQA
jgi:hypothetical protein